MSSDISGGLNLPHNPGGPKKPEVTRFKTLYSMPENLPVLDDRIEEALYSINEFEAGTVLKQLAKLVLLIIDRIERSIYDPYVGCAIYRKACQLLSAHDIDPWELSLGNPITEAFHQDSYDGLPGVDEYEPFTSLALIKLLARAVIDSNAVADEMLSGAYSVYNRERVTMAGLLADERFIPYLKGILDGWRYKEPPMHLLGALGQIATPMSVEIIRKWLTGDNISSLAALEALEHASTPEALKALEEFSKSSEYPAVISVAIAHVKNGISGLLEMAGSRNPDIRAGALDRMGGVKDPRAVRALSEALGDNSPVNSFMGAKDYTVSEVACLALDYYGRAYLRKTLPEDSFEEYRSISRNLRDSRREDDWGYF